MLSSAITAEKKQKHLLSIKNIKNFADYKFLVIQLKRIAMKITLRRKKVMPMVKGKKFAYTKAGKKKAKAYAKKKKKKKY